MAHRSSARYGAVAQALHWATAILWLAGFRALAALYHHVIVKDGVLASMLSRWLPLRGTKGP